MGVCSERVRKQGKGKAEEQEPKLSVASARRFLSAELRGACEIDAVRSGMATSWP